MPGPLGSREPGRSSFVVQRCFRVLSVPVLALVRDKLTPPVEKSAALCAFPVSRTHVAVPRVSSSLRSPAVAHPLFDVSQVIDPIRLLNLC
jgi:hypothetical protein